MTGSSQPLLTIVVPAFNEEVRLEIGIAELMARVRETDVRAEVLVVDDGSTDATAEILAKLETRHPELRGIALDRNRGKGAAVRAGVLAATGRYVLFSDVDQSTPFPEWTKLRERLDVGGFDIAIASREISGAQRLRSRWHRRQMGNVFRFVRDVFVVDGFIDSQCGFKLFTSDAAQTVFRLARLDRFCFDVEVLAIAVHKGLRVVEVPVTWTDDHASKVNAVTDSLSMLKDLWRIRRFRARGLYD